MSEAQAMSDNVQTAHVEGKYGIAKTLITAIATIVAAVIGLYAVTLQNANTTLQQQNNELQEKNDALVVESQEGNTAAEDIISTLQKRISNLEAENATLRNDNSTLQTNYKAALGEIDRLRNELTNATQISAEEETAPIENISNEGLSAQTLDFIEVLQPYESNRYTTPNTMTMMGNTYSNGFQLDFAYSGYALFNLDGTYETLEFDMGHIDGSSMVSISFNVYLDGKFEKTIEANPEMRVTHTSIPLNHALQMKIEFGSHSGSPKYGFANAKIS